MDTAQLLQAFSKAADKTRASDMMRYMKNISPFLGIPRPIRDDIQKSWIAHMKTCDWKVQQKTAIDFWNTDTREHQYAAMDMLVKCKAWNHADSITLFEQLILQKSWWDTVDLIAAKLVGPYYLKFPDKRNALIQRWMDSGNMWLQRTCLIFQLGYKEKTDFDLLRACIIPLLDSREFFIQKAIGWALRQYARSAPSKVLEFANSYPLKPLSRREALKHFEQGKP